MLASAASNRKAERPVNAMLNYLYSLVEAEAILACQAVGLDSGLGRGRQADKKDARTGDRRPRGRPPPGDESTTSREPGAADTPTHPERPRQDDGRDRELGRGRRVRGADVGTEAPTFAHVAAKGSGGGRAASPSGGLRPALCPPRCSTTGARGRSHRCLSLTWRRRARVVGQVEGARKSAGWAFSLNGSTTSDGTCLWGLPSFLSAFFCVLICSWSWALA